MGVESEFVHRFADERAEPVRDDRWPWRRTFAFMLVLSLISWAAIFSIAYLLWTL